MDKLNKIIESYPPELKLLLVCCGSERWNASDLLPMVNWEVFLQWVKRHRVTPAVYRYIKKNPTEVPEEIQKKIEENQNRISRRALLLTSELIKTGKLLDENNIPWFTMKGPVLAMQLYGDVAGRDYRDLDVFIQQSEINRAISILEKEGYYSMLNLKLKNLIKVNHNIEIKNTDKNTKLELHWKLFASNTLSMPFDFHLMNLSEMVLQGNTILLPETHINSCYIFMHASVHQWRELQWLIDCRKLAEKKFSDDITEFFSKNNIMHIISIYNTLTNLLFCRQELNNNLFVDKMALFCLRSIGSLNSSTWVKIKKTAYLLYLSDSSLYKKEILKLRLKRLFSNPAKR